MGCGKCGDKCECGKCDCGRGRKGLCPGSLGMAFGITTAIFMLVCAWSGWLTGYGETMVNQYGLFYYGYAPTLIGGLWGALWGLIEGFIFGFLVGAIYRCCCCKCKCRCCKVPCQPCDNKKM